MEKLQTSSTMQAEFVACYEATEQAVWLKNFIPELIVVDNLPVFFYVNNNKSSGASKYINFKYYVVKDRIHDQTISVKHISTKSMLADTLTKGLPPHIFRDHVASMGLLESL